jgi:hydroxymethylglutaryl-CoA lyase
MTTDAFSRALPRQVVIREVGLRDGLQILQRVVPTATKRVWIREAHAAGLRELEFVPARLMPQLADTAEVLAYAKTLARPAGVGAGAEPERRRARHRR